MSPEADSSAQTQPAVRTFQVQYYAHLREEAGRSEETVESTATTVAELFEELDQRYDFSLPPDDLRVAVNASFADWDAALDAQDLVVFIPPVAGG
jgi:molybdopterin converting factor subunit 1